MVRGEMRKDEVKGGVHANSHENVSPKHENLLRELHAKDPRNVADHSQVAPKYA